MEFWGVQVKSGKPLKVESESDKLLHLSHATIGESKKSKPNESISLSLKIDDQKLVLGTLSPGNTPQLNFDLVFEKDFELSHNWKNGSVFFMGYKSIIPEDDETDNEPESEDDIPLQLENGSLETKVDSVKPSTVKSDKKPESSEKPKAKVEQPQEEEKPKEDDGEDRDDDDDDDDDDDYTSDDPDDTDEDDVEMVDGKEDSSDEDDDEDDSSDDEEDEETPKKAEPSKKRTTESATKTPLPAKKAKFSSPQKTDGKKGVHTDTPHPSKKVGKTPADNKKSSGNKNTQTPTSSGSKVSCTSCSKAFNSEAALQSHSKAKHGAK